MSETGPSDLNSIANASQYINNVDKETDDLESIRVAQDSFRDYLLQTTASIYSSRLQMVQCVKAALDLKNEKLNDLDEINNRLRTEAGTSDSYRNSREESVDKIQNKLSDIILKQSLSVKRSLMKLSNLLTQYNLMNLPHYELILYINQISEYQKNHFPKTFKQPSSKLLYSEALENLEQILKDIENVEDKTLYIIKNYKNVYSAPKDDTTDFFCDDYKDISL